MAENRNLTLSIGGRKHVISIAPGEEDHLLTLAGMVDARIGQLGLLGQTEARMLLIAALTLADELLAVQTAPTAEPAPEPEAPPLAPAQIDPELVARVAQLADRVEKLAARLEQSEEGA